MLAIKDFKMTFQKGNKLRLGMKNSEEQKRKAVETRRKNGSYKHTCESIKKMSESLKGRLVWNTGTKGIMKSNTGSFKKGEHRSPETEFTSEGMSKNNNTNWKGGLTPLNKALRGKSMWKIWREAVFLRDNFTCQNNSCTYCDNKMGTYLHPHHIKPLALYPELAFDVRNGITYCKEFHLNSGLHKGITKELRNGKL